MKISHGTPKQVNVRSSCFKCTTQLHLSVRSRSLDYPSVVPPHLNNGEGDQTPSAICPSTSNAIDVQTATDKRGYACMACSPVAGLILLVGEHSRDVDNVVVVVLRGKDVHYPVPRAFQVAAVHRHNLFAESKPAEQRRFLSFLRASVCFGTLCRSQKISTTPFINTLFSCFEVRSFVFSRGMTVMSGRTPLIRTAVVAISSHHTFVKINSLPVPHVRQEALKQNTRQYTAALVAQLTRGVKESAVRTPKKKEAIVSHLGRAVRGNDSALPRHRKASRVETARSPLSIVHANIRQSNRHGQKRGIRCGGFPWAVNTQMIKHNLRICSACPAHLQCMSFSLSFAHRCTTRAALQKSTEYGVHIYLGESMEYIEKRGKTHM